MAYITVHVRLPDGSTTSVDVTAGSTVMDIVDEVAKTGFAVGTFRLKHEGEYLEDAGVLVPDDVLEAAPDGAAIERRLLEEDGYTVDSIGFDKQMRLGNLSVVMRYVKAGVKPSRDSVYFNCILKGHYEMLIFLFKSKCACAEDLCRSWRVPDSVFYRLLLFLDKDELSKTLTYVSDSQRLKKIISLGADVNSTILGKTPAAKAIASKDATKLRVLMEAGATLSDVDVQNVMRRGKSHLAKTAIKCGVPQPELIHGYERKCGLYLPVARIRRFAAKATQRKINRRPAVLLTAAIEHATTELLSLAAKVAQSNPRYPHRITPRHINEAIRVDSDLASLCGNVSIASAGVPRHVHAALLPKKKAKKTKN